ncbi:MAG TPA: nucleotidyltransferase family protein [Bacteroidales bacterium]|nr:nucleotidyltransferase family protein [Bacteroidales bacterium]
MKAMIFAAGLGTRLRPLTDNKPKALVEINGKTLLEITIQKLKAAGFNSIVVNVHHFSGLVIDFLKKNDNFGLDIEISDETDLLLDTGGGLKKAAPLLGTQEPVLIHNVDIVSNIDIGELYTQHCQSSALATLATMERDSSRQLLVNSKGILCGWQNKSTGEKKISQPSETDLTPISYCGIAVLNPQFLTLIEENGVFSIIDVYLRLAKNFDIQTANQENINWSDVGTVESLKRLRRNVN